MEENNVIHSVIIESRKNLNISGVKDVISFDDETIQLNTAMGRITVKGEELKIIGFNTSTGELSVQGRINAVVYISDERMRDGFLSKLFR